MTEWLGRWKQNGWKTAAGDVKNVKDFKRLDDLCQKIDVKWVSLLSCVWFVYVITELCG